MVDNDDVDFDSMLEDCAQDLDTMIKPQQQVRQSVDTQDSVPQPIQTAP